MVLDVGIGGESGTSSWLVAEGGGSKSSDSNGELVLPGKAVSPSFN